MSETRTQVLIVGGGIVGLTASLFLSRQNVDSLLVERHAGTSIHPRSRGVNRRTMELYRSLGIDDCIRTAGTSLSASMGIYQGSSLTDMIEPHKRKENEGERKFPGAAFFNHISPVEGAWGTQDVIEPVLLEAARQRGSDLRFNTECITFEQEDGGVRANLRNRSDGAEFTVHADYMIAAYGTSSPLKKELGVKMTGAGSLGHLLNILFEADLRELVRGREFSMCYVVHPDVRGLLAAINNSDRWVFHLHYDPKKGEKVEDFPPQRCQELIKLALGAPSIEVNIKSILPWEPTVQVAERLQFGRVFLAGDAAHQMPPWRGQGATSGIADVHNLAWKLAAVLHGQASAALLTTYDEERLPIGRLVSEVSGAAADEYGLFSMDKSPAVKLNFIRGLPLIAGYGYNCDSKAINVEDTTPLFWRQKWLLQTLPWLLSLDGKAGTRAPHIWVQHNDRRISTLDFFGKGFVLLAGAAGIGWCEVVPKVASSVGVEVTAYRAGPAGELVCPLGEWESSAWISPRGALLVRPDGLVAWKSWDQPPNLQQKLTAVLLQALCREK